MEGKERGLIIMANVPSNDPNVDAPANVPAPANLENEPVGHGDEFHPWVGGDDLNNPPPPVSEDEETPPTSPVIPDADGQPIPPIASFGQNFHFGESSSTANLLTGNSKIRTVRKTMSICWSEEVGQGFGDRFVDMKKQGFQRIRNCVEELVRGCKDKKDFLTENSVNICANASQKVSTVEMYSCCLPVRNYHLLFVHDIDMSWYENSRDPSLCCDRTMPPKRSSRGDPPPQLTQDTVNRMIQESVEAAIRLRLRKKFEMKQIVLEDLMLLPLLGNESPGRNEGDDDGGICPPEEIPKME
ncbi:hypothetical protein Tco_0762095 [Tanacetum coccineum]